jgi:hypothetical protein
MLAAERPQVRARRSRGRPTWPENLGKGASQQDGNNRHCEVRMTR